jgi:hypothetical protein
MRVRRVESLGRSNPQMIERRGELEPVQLLVNYWEFSASSVQERSAEMIERLQASGVTQVATFVPWQAFESDIAHRLMKFLTVAHQKKMPVNIIITPEVGVHYSYSGLPKTLMTRDEAIALHEHGGAVSYCLAPNLFLLPSMLTDHFQKRYVSFLTRFQSLLGDLHSSSRNIGQDITITITGSFWKYYRSPRYTAIDAFGGSGGDYSKRANLSFRSFLDASFKDSECADPSPASAQKWKTSAMDAVNRKRFSQKMEDEFRLRTQQMMMKAIPASQVRQTELFTPEADPANLYSNLLQTLAKGNGDFGSLSRYIDQSVFRVGRQDFEGQSDPAQPWFHWTSLGGFQSLSNPEKQFLFLKSLLAAGGRGGGVYLDEAEWFAFSETFRRRALGVVQMIKEKRLSYRPDIGHWVPHLWSEAGTLGELLNHRHHRQSLRSTDLNRICDELGSRTLLVVDPEQMIRLRDLQRLFDWAEQGGVLALPRTPFFTARAKRELETRQGLAEKIEFNVGTTYSVSRQGRGSVVVYDPPIDGDGAHSAWKSFLDSLISFSEIQPSIRFSDRRLDALTLDHSGGDGKAVFILNGTGRKIEADVFFDRSAEVVDLSLLLDGGSSVLNSEPARRFHLNVPPCGILPLGVLDSADPAGSAETANVEGVDDGTHP